MFLQSNGLTRRTLLTSKDEIDDEFQLHSDDMTEEGMLLLGVAYEKWLTKVDNGMDPSDVRILEKALVKIRQEGNAR